MERRYLTDWTRRTTGKYYHKTELQEHIAVVGEPGACYLTHVSPQDGGGITIANEVYDAIKGTELSDTLKVVGTELHLWQETKLDSLDAWKRNWGDHCNR